MGHAGAIISGSAGTAQAKKEALEKVGVRVGRTPSGTAAPGPRDHAGQLTPGRPLRRSVRTDLPRGRRPAGLLISGWRSGAPPAGGRWIARLESCDSASAVGARAAGARQPARTRHPGAARPLVVTGAIAAGVALAAGLAVMTLLVLAGWIAAPHAGSACPPCCAPRRRSGWSATTSASPSAAPAGSACCRSAWCCCPARCCGGPAGGWSGRRRGQAAPRRLRRGRAGRAVRAADRRAGPGEQVGAGVAVGAAGGGRAGSCWR